MKKRLLAMLLALVLVFSLVPGTVIAEGGEHVHCLCGKETAKGAVCPSCGSEAVVWTATSTMPTASGHYYLTGPVSAGAQFLNGGEQISLCLHGQTVTSAAGKKFLYLNKNNVYNITDCTATGVGESYLAGKLTGTTGVDTYGSTIRINAGCALNWYGGILTGNTASDSGIIYVDGSSSASVSGGSFTMYGGQISGNTCQRGTVYGVSTGTNKPVIRILGGTITGNTATGTDAQSGGGAICAFSPVEVGGDAKVHGNTAAKGGGDIWLRNDGSFTGALTVSSQIPLKDGAEIYYSTYEPETDTANLQSITGTPESWQSGWVFYGENKVGYSGGKFFVDQSADKHIHCLCGAETAEGTACDICGSQAVAWTEAAGLPKESGYYCLTGNVSTAPVTPNANASIYICLQGHNITSTAGRKLWYVANGASVTVTDCRGTGTVSGVKNEPAVQVAAESAFVLYGGTITGNTTTGDGVILLEKGSATAPGGSFTMYGGQISGNTVKRGTVTMTNAPGDAQNAIVRILGGTITGNHATGTSVTAGGGAGVLAMGPVEVGGDAKIYGNTAASGPADIYIRNDQKGKLVISDETPLTAGAQIACGLYTSEEDPADLQFVTGSPTSWDPARVTYCGEALRYEEGKFTIARIVVWSSHQHDAIQWISVTEASGWLPETTGHYVLDGDLQLPAEVKVLPGQEVTLCLNGHTLTAAPGLRHFYVASGGSLTICDCTAGNVDGKYTAGTITGADGTVGGGAIRMAPGSVVNLCDGRITGNHTTGEGGAFYLEGCTLSNPTPAVLNMYGGEISENTADKGFGAAIRFAGAADGLSAATFRMEGGVIRDHSSSNFGGAIHAPGKATIELLGGTIENNRAVGGGAVSVNGATKVILNGTVIRGNTAEKWGGGLYLKTGATMEMLGGEVSGNSSKIGAGILLESQGTSLTLSGGKITKNAAGTAGGGGVYVGVGCEMTMSGGTICENTSKAGGAGVSVITSTLTVTGGSICHNQAATWGAGALVSTDAKLILNGGAIDENYTPKIAAGIYAWCSEVEIHKGSVSNNVAEDNTGGIRLTGSRLTMTGGSVSGNLGNTGSGAGITCEQASRTVDGVKTNVPGHIVMYGGSVSYNKAAKAAAGVQLMSKGSTFTMYGGTVSHNHSGKYACGVYVGKGTSFSMHGGSVCYNTLDTGGVAGVFHDGGTGNHTGGEIYGNVSPVSGGGFCASGQDNVVYAKGLKIYDNTAKVGAGVLVQIRATLHMEDCEIYNNSSTMHGGGVYMYSYTTMTMKNSAVRGNQAQKDGGGIWTWATSHLTLDGCEVAENKAVEGDGGGFWTRGDSLTVLNSTIRDNQTPGSGGGIFAGMMGSATLGYVDYIRMENTAVENNTAGKQGGGIYLSQGSKAVLTDTRLLNNEASAEGGALWAKEDLTMANVTVTGNTSGGQGYAVWLDSSDYDGHSYYAGVMKMSGNMQVADNQGGDLYLGEKVSVILSELGEETKIHVNMHSGLLTRWVWGTYDYEGGDGDYIITCGERSVTEPEYKEPEPEAPEEPVQPPCEMPTEGEKTGPEGNTGLYIGIAATVAVIAAAAVAIVLAAKKKKSAK